MAKGSSVFAATKQFRSALVNTGEPTPGFFPEREEAEWRVLRMQRKLHRWAVADPGRRFDDLANLVYDPAFLVVALAQGARQQGCTDRRCRRGHSPRRR